MPRCVQCHVDFKISQEEEAFLKQLVVPIPTCCPLCRQRRRLASRNTRTLYRRRCQNCQKEHISIHAPQSNITVWCLDCYWSEQWDPLRYGRAYDFSRGFFEQFQELHKAVPTMTLIVLQPSTNINSAYTNDVWRNKNCYLVFDGEAGEESFYGETYFKINNCIDFYRLIRCELCYECVGCERCYDLKFSSWCSGCSHSSFLLDCAGCRNCFGCINLVNQEYCIYNEQVGKEAYEQFIKTIDLRDSACWKNVQEKFRELYQRTPRRATRGQKNENVTGDNLFYCTNVEDCYNCSELTNSRYCTELPLGGKDCQDIDIWGGIEQCYNCAGVGENVRRIIASYYIWGHCYNIEHSMFCSKGSHDLFGCIGLQKQQYCILNTQYTEAEYMRLREKIIQQMRDEYAQFWPIGYFPFAYNETKAQDFLPLTQEDVLNHGWKWYEQPPIDAQEGATHCSQCAKPFRFTPQEITFYEKNRLSKPKQCFACRHQRRIQSVNPRKLYQRICDRCAEAIVTTYSPDRPETIYCEKCYREVVY